MFQTRIYPIPAHKSRTVKIVYSSELVTGKDNSAIYVHPVPLERNIDFSASVEVVANTDSAPVFANEGFGPVKFDRTGGSFVCKIERNNCSARDASIAVVLPPQLSTGVYVESAEDAHYFAISDALPTCEDEPRKY